MYKRHPCRHFEPSGKPISLGCMQGENCRFLHPGDPNWRNDRRGRSTLPSSPLLPQSYAFRRRQRGISRSRSPRPSRDKRNRTQLRHTRIPSKDVYRGQESKSGHRRTPSGGRKDQQKDTGITKKEIPANLPCKPKESVSERHNEFNLNNSGQIWTGFMEIARLSRESDELSEQQKKEESKIATYNAVGKALNEISNQMGLAVSPQIEHSSVVQQDCIKTIAENRETVKKICTDVVRHFVADISNAVDNHLRGAMQTLKNEGESVRQEIQKQSAAISPRWEGRRATGVRYHSPDFDSITKKRRVHTPSPPRLPSEEVALKHSELMRELEEKIERQAEALINLTKENEMLRAQNLLHEDKE